MLKNRYDYNLVVTIASANHVKLCTAGWHTEACISWCEALMNVHKAALSGDEAEKERWIRQAKRFAQ